TTIVIAMTKAIVCTSASGTPAHSRGSATRCATAGSAIAPRPSEHTVMPSCAPAIMSETCSIARSVSRAAREPSAAFGSICVRRAATSANSAPTKKALAARSRTASSSAPPSATVTPAGLAPAGRSLRGAVGGLVRRGLVDAGQHDPVDAPAVEPDDAQPHRRRHRDAVLVEPRGVPRGDVDDVAHLAEPLEPLGQQTGE